MKKGRRLLVVMIILCLPILSLAIFCGANIAKASTCVVAINGGSIYLTSGANMTMDGNARISGSSGENGGAIYIGDGATLTMTGGIIDSCSATNGGAIYIASGGTFIFNGGTISNCMANLGYAIYIQRGGNIIMSGGSFVNCGEDEGLHIYAEETLVTMYVDDEIKGMVLVGETETLNDIVTPLSSEECCGWFLDSELTEVLDYDASLEELAGNELFINLYTKTATPEKLTFTLDSATDTYIVSKASGSTIRDEVVIPREYNGKTVSAIYEGTSGSTGAFASCSMTSIYLPSTITEISDYSFYNCQNSLAEINLHNNMTHIGYEAFRTCSFITSIVIPDSVTSIDSYAFRDCSGLISVTIGENVTSIGSGAFIYCDEINEINYNAINCNDLAMYSEVFSNCGSYDPGIVVNIGNKVERIPAYLFCYSRGSSYPRVKQVIFEENSICASIGDYAFGYCDTLESFYVPASVTSLSYNIFWDCDNIESLVVDENNPVYDSRNNCNAIIETATNTLLRGCVNTVIPNSILIIGESAFYSRDEITQLNIPNGVVSIGERAFYDCSGLTSVEIPNTVTNIGEYAFYGCSGVTVLSIGEGVTTIGSFAFGGLRNLTELNYNAINASIGNSTPFSHAGQDASGIVVNFGNKVTKIPARLFCISIDWSYTPNIVEVKFAENSVCESIGSNAFMGCKGLTSITFPESLISIGNEAFSLCSGLTSIEIPRNVSSIDSQAFQNCSGLTSIVVDENNSVYDSRNNCNAIIQTGRNGLILGCLNTVIPDSVTAINGYAFYGCKGLTSIYIPDSVTAIDNYAFYGCKGLTSIYIPLSVTAIFAANYHFSPFYSCSTDLVIYCGAEEKPSGWATYWNYRSNNATFTTYWGYTREEYEQAISSSAFAHSISNVCYEKSGNIPSLETSFEALSSRLTLNDADVRDIKLSLYETSDNQNNKSYTETSIVLNEKREYLTVEKKKAS